MIDTLVSVLLHLPFGVMLAVVALEFFAISRRSKTADEAVIVLLCVAGASLVLAVAIAGYLAFGEGAAGAPFGNVWFGLGATLLAGIALGLKVLCRRRGIASVDFGGRGRGATRRAKGRSKGEQVGRAMILVGYRSALAAAAAVLFTGILMVKSSPFVPPAAVAETETETETETPLAPEEPAAPTPEPAVAVAETTEPPAPAPVEPKLEPEPEPEPVVAAVEPAPSDPPATTEIAATVPEPEPETPAPAETEPVAAVESPDAPETMEEGTKEMEETMVASNDPAAKPVTPEMVPTTTPVKPAIATPAPATPTPIPAPMKSARNFLTLVQPLLKDRCYECHGPDKQKGDLRLDTVADIRKGGKSGPVVVVGKPDKSSLFTLVSLPPDDDDIMPPKGSPLTEPQAGYIRSWILDGAPLGDGEKWPGEDALASMGDPDAEPLPDGLTMPDPALLAQLEADGVEVLVLPGNGAMLEIGLTHADRPAGQLRLDQLAPIAKNIQSLDLKKTKVSDDDLTILEDMTSLTKLNLALTKVGDPSMSHIRRLENLEYLNLYGTEVSDRSVTYIKDLKKLTKLFLWNSKVTESGVAKLKKELPKAEISVGG